MSNVKIRVKVDADMSDIMPYFLRAMKKDVAAIEDALPKKEYQFLIDFGHKLKGNGPSYGLNDLGQMGIEIEKAAKNEKIDLCISIFEKIKDYMKRLEIEYVSR